MGGVRVRRALMYTHDFDFIGRRLAWVHICGSSSDVYSLSIPRCSKLFHAHPGRF